MNLLLCYMTIFKEHVLFFYFRFKYMSVETPNRHNQAQNVSPFKERAGFVSLPNLDYLKDESISLNQAYTDSSNKRTVGQYGTMENLIKPPNHYYNEDLYDNLINIILNAKKDIKFHPSCITKEGAERYAKTRGLRVKKESEDLNHDGIEDIVVYNKAGKPIMINGYTFSQSEFPYKQDYYKQKPADRANQGGYKGFLNKIWGVQEEKFDENGTRVVEHDNTDLPDEVEKYSNLGWKKLKAPKRALTIYQRINKWLANILRETIENDDVLSQYQKLINSSIPRFKIISLANLYFIDAAFIRNTNVNIPGANYQEKFKNWMEIKQKSKTAIRNALTDNFAIITADTEKQKIIEFFTHIINELMFNATGGTYIDNDQAYLNKLAEKPLESRKRNALIADLKEAMNEYFVYIKDKYINKMFDEPQQ